MEGFFRRARPISDARPPASPSSAPSRGARTTCVRCGEAVSGDQSIDRGSGVEHLVCEPAVVADLERRLEASRALHRALHTLRAIEPLRATIEEETRSLADVIDPAEVLGLLARLRTSVELARFARPEQRRLSLSLLDALTHRLRDHEPRARPTAPEHE